MRIAKVVCLVFVCQLLCMSTARAQEVFAAPVPSQILTAKKVFISNGGSQSFSMSERYTGEAYRGYNQFYGALQKSARFQLVATPAEADLVLEIATRVPVAAPDHLQLTIYETKSHFVLWSMDSWIEVAARRATSDRNFDIAVTRLASNFEKLAAPPQP